jgi:hypothetical protein
MGYLDRVLGREEKLLCRAHFHWLRYAEAWLLFFLIFLLGAVANAVLPGAGTLPLAIGAVLAGAALLVKLLPLWTTEIGVTDHRLIVKRGWLRLTTSELQLRAIEEVTLDQHLMGRLLNYGRIDVHGTGVDDVSLPTIAGPIELMRTLQDATANAQKAARFAQ